MFFRHLIFFTLFVMPAWVTGQNNPFIFYSLKEKDGLSNNVVNCFLKDTRGILWIGTFDGLNRFDGAHFYSFKRTKEPNSIVNNAVHALCEDRQKKIWGATENGFFCYDPEKNVFKNYFSPNSKLVLSAANTARAGFNILCDRQGNIWATGIWTILKFNPSKEIFEEMNPLSSHSDSLNYYGVRKNGMIEDPSGNGLWLTTRRGLHFYDFKTGQFLSYKNQRDSVFTNHSVAALFKSVSGCCWFFDNKTQQIVAFDPVTKKIIRKIDIASVMPNALGATLFEDSEQRIWFSSWSSEIVVVDQQNGNTITRIKNDKNDPLSIPGDFFWCAREDEDGTLWLGTLAGISKCNASKSIYRIHRLAEKFPFLADNSIRLMIEDPADESWWLTTRNKLFVIHYFPVTGKYVLYDFQVAEKNIHGALPGPVYGMRFVKNKLVLSTHNGAWQIETGGHTMIPFSISRAVDARFIIRNMVEHNGIYYFTDGQKILKYNSNNDEVNQIKYPHERLHDDQGLNIDGLFLSPGKKLWFWVAMGWIGYVNEKNEIIPVNIIKNEDEEMIGFFTSIDVDRQGKLWLASKGAGLYRFDPVNGLASFWSEADGLMYNHIQTVVSDNNGNIWCAAYNKFSVFTPASESFYNFSLPLSENNLNYDNGLTLLANGNVLASLQNNIIEFYPERLNLKPYTRKPFTGSINVAGTEKFITTESVQQLDPDEKFLSLKFGLLTDRETFPYSFEYKLEGFDDNWITALQDNQAVYNKLPPGNYTFRLVAKAKNGAWTSPETVLRIHVKTPFFRSVWFYTAAILLVSLLLFLFYRFRTNKQKQLHALTSKAQLLEKEKTIVMYESLKQQLNPHFLFNSLTSLNSLIAADPPKAGAFLDSLSKTYRYILKSRDSETVSLGDEIKFAESYVRLQQTRFEKGLLVNMNVSGEYYHRKIVPVTLQNLIENAIKHNIIDEDSPLQITIYSENDFLVVKNNIQKKKFVETSNKQGLSSLQSLYHYLSDRPLEINEDPDFFTIKIPLL